MRAIVSLLTLLPAACGSASTAPDAAPPDAVVLDGEVEVVLGSRAAAPDATITVFSSHDGTVVRQIEGAAAGEVVRIGLVRGSTVSAAYQSLVGTSVVSFLGAQPGDVLIAGDGPPTAMGPREPIAFDWPGFDGQPYQVITACSALTYSSANPMLLFDARCEPDASTDLLVLRSGAGGGWRRIDDVPLGSTATMTTLQPFGSFSATIQGDVGVGMEVIAAIEGRDAVYAELAYDPNFGKTIVTGTGLVTGDELWVRLATNDEVVRSDVLPGGATTWMFDRDTLRPLFETVMRHKDWLFWDVLPGERDGYVAHFTWSRGGRWYHWVLIAPAEAERIPWPAMPDHLGGVIPGFDENDFDYCLQAIDFDDDDGYDDMRWRPEWRLDQLRGPPGPGSWTDRYTAHVSCFQGF